ncbi:MAG: ATP-binding cassette domain-containing protein [Promethearchaeota archaeon]
MNINEGEIVVVLGPSGSGKTTLLNLIGGLDRPTDGEIIVDGREITKFSDSELNRYRQERIFFEYKRGTDVFEYKKGHDFFSF